MKSKNRNCFWHTYKNYWIVKLKLKTAETTETPTTETPTTETPTTTGTVCPSKMVTSAVSDTALFTQSADTNLFSRHTLFPQVQNVIVCSYSISLVICMYVCILHIIYKNYLFFFYFSSVFYVSYINSWTRIIWLTPLKRTYRTMAFINVSASNWIFSLN